jgi:hypothetical protein
MNIKYKDKHNWLKLCKALLSLKDKQVLLI